uniref:Protein phosphatase 1 regulatory subunit 3C (Trinotate prediction) n=1 Tax=Myxobolus squamalis TaxID=59785 RepID=A0A6B2G6Q4_MYXSQ
MIPSKMNQDKGYKSLLKNASVDQQSVEDRSLKSVCFADAKGHELVNVRNFVPSSENLFHYESLENFNKIRESSNLNDAFICTYNDFKWITYFKDLHPPSQFYFEELNRQKVILESLSIVEQEGYGIFCLQGLVRVVNLSYRKTVFLRGSYQNWITHFEVGANFESHSEETNTDLFVFKFPLKNDSAICSKTMEFAIAYVIDGSTYWDNNNGKNYIIYQI